MRGSLYAVAAVVAAAVFSVSSAAHAASVQGLQLVAVAENIAAVGDYKTSFVANPGPLPQSYSLSAASGATHTSSSASLSNDQFDFTFALTRSPEKQIANGAADVGFSVSRDTPYQFDVTYSTTSIDPELWPNNAMSVRFSLQDSTAHSQLVNETWSVTDYGSTFQVSGSGILTGGHTYSVWADAQATGIDSASASASVDFRLGASSPAPVPLPAAAWAGMSLLGALGGFRLLRRVRRGEAAIG